MIQADAGQNVAPRSTHAGVTTIGTGWGPGPDHRTERPEKGFQQMRNLMTKTFVKLQDRRMQMHQDEEGLSMLAYALGAALVVVPISAALLTFGTGAVTDAEAVVDGAIAGS